MLNRFVADALTTGKIVIWSDKAFIILVYICGIIFNSELQLISG